MSDRFTTHKLGRGKLEIRDNAPPNLPHGYFYAYNLRVTDEVKKLAVLLNQLDTQAKRECDLGELDFEEETHA